MRTRLSPPFKGGGGVYLNAKFCYFNIRLHRGALTSIDPTTTSKQQEGCTFKDSHPKCFITTNFDKFHREAFARAVNRGDILTACFRDIQSQRSIRMAFVRVCNYYDFIRREGLSLALWFDIVEFRENIHMTVKIFANVHQLMFLVLKLVWIRLEYSLV